MVLEGSASRLAALDRGIESDVALAPLLMAVARPPVFPPNLQMGEGAEDEEADEGEGEEDDDDGEIEEILDREALKNRSKRIVLKRTSKSVRRNRKSAKGDDDD